MSLFLWKILRIYLNEKYSFIQLIHLFAKKFFVTLIKKLVQFLLGNMECIREKISVKNQLKS